MPPSNQRPEPAFSFINYLQFLSDMLGGDTFPLQRDQADLAKQICERSIDYNLNQQIVAEVKKHNAVFHLQDLLEPYPTLDALGAIRARLLDNKGDIHQISLIDRIGELSVSFFNLQTVSLGRKPASSTAPRAVVRPILGRRK